MIKGKEIPDLYYYPFANPEIIMVLKALCLKVYKFNL